MTMALAAGLDVSRLPAHEHHELARRPALAELIQHVRRDDISWPRTRPCAMSVMLFIFETFKSVIVQKRRIHETNRYRTGPTEAK